jgi:hypothetical protein
VARITRLGNEEEESAKRRVLEEELRRNKVRLTVTVHPPTVMLEMVVGREAD